jgi:hypothetical protein
MLRIPLPIVLATVIFAGVATVYFYVIVVSQPAQGAWSDQGVDQTFTYVVPAGGWALLGTFGGSSIVISSNVTIDIRADVFTAQVWSNLPLPEGRWSVGNLYVHVQPGPVYGLGQTAWSETCTGASVVQLANGMYMYYPNYTAPGASCRCPWPFSSYTIDANGVLRSCGAAWPSSSLAVSVNGVTSYTIRPPVYSLTVGRGTTIYYIYTRPTYTVWVRPRANATITVAIYP